MFLPVQTVFLFSFLHKSNFTLFPPFRLMLSVSLAHVFYFPIGCFLYPNLSALFLLSKYQHGFFVLDEEMLNFFKRPRAFHNFIISFFFHTNFGIMSNDTSCTIRGFTPYKLDQFSHTMFKLNLYANIIIISDKYFNSLTCVLPSFA